MRGFLEILNFSNVLILAGNFIWNAENGDCLNFSNVLILTEKFNWNAENQFPFNFSNHSFLPTISIEMRKINFPLISTSLFISAHNFNWNAENQFPPDFLQSFHFRPQFHFKCGKSTPLRYSFSAHTFNPNAENWNFFPLAFRPKLQTPSFLLQNLKFLAHSFFSCILFSSRIFPYLAVRSEWKSGKWVCETRKFWPRNEFLEGKCPNWKGIVTKILYKELLKELK